MIIESHAHYSHKRYDGTFRYLTGQLTAEEGNRDGLLKRLRESGVDRKSTRLNSSHVR